MASSLFEYDCEAVRVYARRLHPRTGVEEQRRFSVDPNLTTFDILRSILMRAFEVTETEESEFVIYFCSVDAAMDWMPLLSDWDLDMAILSSAEPALSLFVAEKKAKKLFNPLDVRAPSEIADLAITVDSSTKAVGGHDGDCVTKLSCSNTGSERVPSEVVSQQIPEGSIAGTPGVSSPAMFASLRQQVEKTLPSITNKLNRVFAAAEENIIPKGQEVLSFFDSTAYGVVQQMSETRSPPLSEIEFRSFLNKVGEVVKPKDLRLAVYQRGADPAIRKVLWKHLLGIYPQGLTGKDRVEFVKRKCSEYEDLKHQWIELVLQGRMTDDLKYLSNMVKKDVLRTDRHLPFYSGDGNTNVNILYNVLTTYALNHPIVGYCQGMSDLLSPLLVVMRDEGQAYLSFCALMSRTAGNFRTDGKLMTTKFEHLSQSLLYYDPEFYAYLKLRHADDLLFCYRWLLLELKREFSFDDACLAIEVLWSSLPPPPQSLKSMANGGGVQLFEQRFQQPEDRNIKAMGGVDVYNIASSSTKTKFQPSSSLTGGSEGYFQGRKHNGRAGTAFSNIVSVRKRVSSDEEGLLHSISTNASVKGARSKTFVVRSRRIQSAGSAEEEIMKSKNNGEHNIHVSLDGKPKETSDSRSVLQSTSGDVDAVKEDSSKVQETNVGTESYTGDEDKSGEPKNSSLPRQERKPSYM